MPLAPSVLGNVHLQDSISFVPPVPDHIRAAAVIEPSSLQKAAQHLLVAISRERVRPANADRRLCCTSTILQFPEPGLFFRNVT